MEILSRRINNIDMSRAGVATPIESTPATSIVFTGRAAPKARKGKDARRWKGK